MRLIEYLFVVLFSSLGYIVLLFSESSAPFANYDTGFARENIRLEKDVLSKLGVS